jgi:guanine nucleotide-binding protein subunit alpha
MQDSLKLFETIIGNQWFNNTPVIVMFNKTDLLQQKVKKSNVSDYLPEYKGHYSK